jgi:Ser/Thr protein kinase RdoA (MazF antagonist)
MVAGLSGRPVRGRGAKIGDRVADVFEAVMPRTLRIHGDCHRGNVLWTDTGAHIVDLDDCATGPAVQDLWMLCAGTIEDRRRQWSDVLEGYEQFATFDRAELALVEPLRAFRMLHYAAVAGAAMAGSGVSAHSPGLGALDTGKTMSP